MATYKVIQDIEAEDKLLGPLTLRQFIYAAIVVVSGFICFRLLFVAWWLALPLLPPMLLFGVLAAPFGHDQPSEVWLLAKIRFFLKPRRRIWDQSGVKELVTITAPKRIERNLTKNLSQDEVRSRLQALANTIDSRGWAVKNVSVNMLTQPGYAHQNSDRLIDASLIHQTTRTPAVDITAVDDMLDEQNNPTAQHLDRMINASAQNRREQLISQLQQGGQVQQPTPAAGQRPDYWFLNSTGGQSAPTKNGYAAFDHNPLVLPGSGGQYATAQVSAEEEQALLEKIHQQEEDDPHTFGHLKVIQPLSARGRKGRHAVSEKTRAAHQKHRKPQEEEMAQPASGFVAPQGDPMAQNNFAQAPAYKPQNTPMKTPSDPVILELANNDDLNVATIARQANKIQEEKLANGEVVIKLH